MAFWKRKKKQPKATNPSPPPSQKKKQSRAPLELKLAAVDALGKGLSAREVADLLGVSDASIYKWRQVFDKEGVAGLQKKAASPSVKRRCEALEARIVARRQENPQAGVRRIRDELRREEGLAVSAETVRQVVNEHGQHAGASQTATSSGATV
jgi:transposase